MRQAFTGWMCFLMPKQITEAQGHVIK